MATSVKIGESLKERVQNLAVAKDRSSHWVMCEAIRSYVDREESKVLLKKEAMNSWVHYQETGQHLTHKEVNDWLDTWGLDSKKIPPCHQ